MKVKNTTATYSCKLKKGSAMLDLDHILQLENALQLVIDKIGLLIFSTFSESRCPYLWQKEIT